MDCQFIANVVDIVGLLSVGSQILRKKILGKKYLWVIMDWKNFKNMH